MIMILMNRALYPSITRKDPRYFSVQSKNEIWWLVAFEVPKGEGNGDYTGKWYVCMIAQM